jgi:hypothetical protein
MISRDFEALEKEYNELRGMRDDVFSGLPEMAICRTLLVERANALKKLKRALDSHKLESVEQALAVACYLGLTGDTVTSAKEFIGAVDAEVPLALRPLLRAIRGNDYDAVHLALQELHRIGWHDPSLTPEIVYMILDRHNYRVKVRILIPLSL